MQDISSSIRIEDGFSEPLKGLAKASWDVENAAIAVSKAYLEQQKTFKDIAQQEQEYTDALKNNLRPALVSLKNDAVAVKDSFVNMIHQRDMDSVDQLSEALKNLNENVKSSAKSAKDWITGYSSVWFMLKNKKWFMLAGISLTAFNRLKDQSIKGFMALKESIEKSIDDIGMSEKLEAMWGEAGIVAKQRAYELANQIGESAQMVTELSAKAAYEGIGTDQFERMMMLADKVAKLKPGETTESAANALMTSLKSGHDAGSIAQLYGGGDIMERQLRRAGYERALNRGDIDKALEIAEKIAEQSGLTKENYGDAYSNMSQNFKRIFNVIDNVKKRLGETFNRSFAPTVAKIKDFVTGEKFQTVVNIFDKILGLAGKILNVFAEGIIDNIQVMGVLLAVAGVAKFVIMAKKIALIIKMSKTALAVLKLFRGPIGMIIGGLSRVIKHLISIGAKQAMILIKTKAMQALKVAGPWLLVGAAIAGALKILHSLFGESKSFSDFLMGILGAAWQLGANLFTNLFVALEKLADKLRVVFLKVQSAMVQLKQFIMSKIGDIIKWLLDKLKDSPIGWLLEQLGVDVGSAVEDAKSWASGLGSEEASKLAEIAQEIKGIQNKQLDYIDVMNGVKEAYDSNGETMKKFFKDLFTSNKKQEEEQKGIAGNTDKIRKINEQEEELAWLKAFSDRQIVSSISQMTSNVMNLNQYGSSDDLKKETMRRIAGRPGRYATLH